MKATIDLDEALYRRLKAAAAMQGRRVKDLVADGIQRVLELPSKTDVPVPISLPVLKRRGRGVLRIPADAAHRAETLIEVVSDAPSR